MKFSWEGKEYELNGITGKPSKVIRSNGMTQLLKKGHQGVVAQLCSLDVQTSKIPISQDIQRVINKKSKVFEYIPKGIPPIHEFSWEGQEFELRGITGNTRKVISSIVMKFFFKGDIKV